MDLDTFETKVLSVHPITPRVKQFLLAAPDHRFSFKLGQHTRVVVDQDGEPVQRPYTPINQPGTDRLILGIKRYEGGTASQHMHTCDPGDKVTLTELGGNLYLRDLDHDAVFMGTGTGVTPMLAMLQQYLREGRGRAVFMFGERTQEDLMFRETIDQLVADHPSLRVFYVLSQESWPGPTGYVQEHLDEALEHVSDEAYFYACGVPAMVVDTTDQLQRRGIPEERIITEGWERNAVEE